MSQRNISICGAWRTAYGRLAEAGEGSRLRHVRCGAARAGERAAASLAAAHHHPPQERSLYKATPNLSYCPAAELLAYCCRVSPLPPL